MNFFTKGLQITICLSIIFIGDSCAFGGLIYGTPADLTGIRNTIDLNIAPILKTGKGKGKDNNNGEIWSDAKVEWNISNNGDGTFDYQYMLSNFNQPGISHFTLDLTDDAFLEGVLVDLNAVSNSKLNGFFIDPGSLEFGNKDGISGSVKFDVGADGNLTYSFTSNRAPVWGDFYIKGGQAFATNLSFGDQTGTAPLGYIARPNGILPHVTSSAPEPSSIMLASFLMLLLLGRVYTSHHKQKQKEKAYSQSPLSST